jgi:hypothetical protein
MSAAGAYDCLRATAVAQSLSDGRVIPAGMEGLVLKAMPDGTCLVELAFRPQRANRDGDFALAALPAGQYDIVKP